MTQFTASFKDNLQMLPPASGFARVELLDASGAVVSSIENQPGKQGSLVVYAHLAERFGALTAQAAALGCEIFAEHTEDARARPGAHPNIDRLFAILSGAPELGLRVITA